MDMEKYTFRKNGVSNNTSLILNINDDFATDAFKEDVFNNSYVENTINNEMEPVIDYEKKLFVPAYSDIDLKLNEGKLVDGYGKPILEDLDKHLHPINSLTYKLYFREREGLESGWTTDDINYWNAFGFVTGETKDIFYYDNTTKFNGDFLGDIGFEMDDIYYQKKALSKSFLRLSIYDSPYRSKQKLLGYSTMFFDTNKMYKKYVDCKFDTPDAYKGDILSCLFEQMTTTFTSTSKYDLNASSDGFYFYLFDGIISGNTCTKLYMKVEFNHAKYGVTIPFLYPLLSNGKSITPIKPYTVKNGKDFDSNPNFPYDYTVIKTSGTTKEIRYVDMDRLNNDLYIPIFVKYNYQTNEYVWFFGITEQKPSETNPFNDANGNIVLELYEPRINSTKTT